MEYGGFWRRLGAFVVDVVVMLPVVATVVYWGLPRSQLFLLYWLVPSIAINVAYNIYFVRAGVARQGYWHSSCVSACSTILR